MNSNTPPDDSSLPEDLGLFSGPLGEEAPKIADPGHIAVPDPVMAADDEPRSPGRERRALRRLQGKPPTAFERVIDLLYAWQEQRPHISIMEIMRTVINQGHQNINDESLAKAMEGLIKQERLARIQKAITDMGIDDAERLLGLKKDD